MAHEQIVSLLSTAQEEEREKNRMVNERRTELNFNCHKTAIEIV